MQGGSLRAAIFLGALLATCFCKPDDEVGDLHDAVRNADFVAVIDAIDAGSDLNERDALGYTPLHRAAEEGSVEIVKLLLERGAADGVAKSSVGVEVGKRKSSIDSLDHNQATAIMLAAGGGHLPVITLLVEAGADISLADEFGLSPLHYAAEGGHAEAVEKLLIHGADPAAMDEVGKTAMDVAKAWGFFEVARRLGAQRVKQGLDNSRGGPLAALRRPDVDGKTKGVTWGGLRFPHKGSSERVAAPSKWCALEPNSDVSNVVGLLTKTWALQWPDVIISVTGAAVGSIPDLNEESREVVETGLLDSVRATKAWVVSGGTDGGVMELVGRTMARQHQEEKNVCLGVVTWGIVRDHELLETRNGRIRRYAPDTSTKTNGPRVLLEPHHTHFLMVDAGPGTAGQFGKEIELRASLENHFCVYALDVKPLCTVMVLLVVAGGVGTLTTVLSVLEKKQPVVIVSDSGGLAADIFNFVCRGELPTNDLPNDHKGYGAREQAVQLCHEKLPTIKSLGAEEIGLRHTPLLSFVNGATIAEKYSTPLQRSKAFTTALLEPILSKSPRILDAFLRAISWENPDILLQQIPEKLVNVTSFDLDSALEQALIYAVTERTPKSLKCVTILLDAGATPSGIRFNALCHALLGRYGTAVPLQDIQARLLSKLQIGSLEDLGDFARSPSPGPTSPPFQRRGTWGSSNLTDVLPSATGEASGNVSAPQPSPSTGGFAAAATTAVAVDRFRRNLSSASSKSGKESSRGPRRSKWQPRMALGEKDEGHENVLGFYVLEELGAHCGYRAHLRARSRVGGFLRLPGYTDLMMWSVLMGNFEAARLLWRHSPTPMRDAVMARRICLKLTETVSVAFAAELEEAADGFEDRAIGMLDQINKEEEAVPLLTNIPTRKEDGQSTDSIKGRSIKLWAGSVIDAAMHSKYPCRRLVAHRHCQFVLDLYLSGTYRGSRASVPHTTSIGTLLVQTLFMILQPICLGRFPFEACAVREPFFDEEGEREEEPESNAASLVQGGEAGDEFEEHDEDYFSADRRGGVQEEQTDASRFNVWFAYWRIPLVRFINHAIFSLTCIVFLMVILFNEREEARTPSNATSNAGTSEEFDHLLRGNMLDQPPGVLTIEILFWVFYAGRIIEIYYKVYKEIIEQGGLVPGLREYSNRFWNKADLLLLILQGLAFVLRVMLVPMSRSGEVAPDVLARLNQIQFDFQVGSLILFILRFVEVLTCIPAMGEGFLILVEMITQAVPELTYILIVALTLGIALHVSTRYWIIEAPLSTRHPAFAGMWAVLGDVEFVDNLYQQDGAEALYFNWLPILVWVGSFFTTIFVVNLMIAKMTTTYEKIHSNAHYYNALQRCDFTIEFKDQRGAPPPLNLLTLTMKLLQRLWDSILKRERREVVQGQHGFGLQVGHEASLRLQSRERLYAQNFDEQVAREEAMRPDSLVSSMHENLGPMLRRIGRRCDALEGIVGGLDAKIDAHVKQLHEAIAAGFSGSEEEEKAPTASPKRRAARRLRRSASPSSVALDDAAPSSAAPDKDAPSSAAPDKDAPSSAAPDKDAAAAAPAAHIDASDDDGAALSTSDAANGSPREEEDESELKV